MFSIDDTTKSDDVIVNVDGGLSLQDIEDKFAAKDHTHPQYSEITHTHSQYALSNHVHTEYAPEFHTHPYYAIYERFGFGN